MDRNKVKIISPPKKVRHTHGDNWEVMKPFVIFSYKALKVIAVALIAIIKVLLPALKPHNDSHSTEVKRK
ncbi:MAG: hypothetical protein JWP78_237 [Mucilaginibacter sp.]|nr:hypothetical protein [Mucilaginibacter sp.]